MLQEQVYSQASYLLLESVRKLRKSMLEPILTGHRIAVCNEHSATYYYWLVLALPHDDAVVHTNTVSVSTVRVHCTNTIPASPFPCPKCAIARETPRRLTCHQEKGVTIHQEVVVVLAAVCQAALPPPALLLCPRLVLVELLNKSLSFRRKPRARTCSQILARNGISASIGIHASLFT